MSPPIWLLDPSFMEKKQAKSSNHIKNSTLGMKKKSCDNVHTISDLLADMQDIVGENAKLHSENAILKKEVATLRSKNEALTKDAHICRGKFEEDLNQLHNNIKLNEAQLIDSSKKCLQQQKKQIEEIVALKAEKEKLRLELAKHKDEHEKVKNIENELKTLQQNYNTIRIQNEENGQKSSRYKNKLKYAITIINDLNNMLIQHTKKSKLSTSETQTEDLFDIQEVPSCPTCTSSHTTNHRETENMLLGEIFFKTKSFCDNELLLINETD